MSNHWIIHEEHKGCTMYERVDYVPTGSRVLAEEIDGKPKAQAVAILESMFDRVKTRNGSPRIFCYKEPTNELPEKFRVKKLFTQKELAKASGVSQVTIMFIEQQLSEPMLLTKQKLCRVLKAEVEDVFPPKTRRPSNHG